MHHHRRLQNLDLVVAKKSFVRRRLVSPEADTEKSSRDSDLLFRCHSIYPGISRRYPPDRPTYFRPSKFEMNQFSLACHFLFAALFKSRVRILSCRAVSCVLHFTTDLCIDKIVVPPFFAFALYNCRSEILLVSCK